MINQPYKLVKGQLTPYVRHQITLVLQAALNVLKELFFPQLLPCEITLVLTYVVSNPLVLLKKALFSFYNVLSYNTILMI